MKHFLLSFLLCFSLFEAKAQIEATTVNGEKVILNDDKTWAYAEKEENNQLSTEMDLSCSSLILIEEDKMTGDKTPMLKDAIVLSKDGGTNGIAIYLMKAKNSIIFSLTAIGAGNCIDKGDKINFLFRDGTRMESGNMSNFNCDNKSTMYLGGIFGGKKNLIMLSEKEIATLRVWTSDGYVEEDLSNDDSMVLKAAFKCLTEI
ncbi:hypothetical protein [Echinicola sediminis]